MTFFIPNAKQFAYDTMLGINPPLAGQYANLIHFLALNPEAVSRKTLDFGSQSYILDQAKAYAESRQPKTPKPPATIPDELVSIILNSYFDIPEARLEQAKNDHSLSMAAENIVGDLLERYLAFVMEPRGWIWCAGSIIRAVDFIKPQANGTWELLQVKNRDNSENSSSSAIRSGTDIKKWFRTFSRKPASNWAAFPDTTVRQYLSEDNFKNFVH